MGPALTKESPAKPLLKTLRSSQTGPDRVLGDQWKVTAAWPPPVQA
jgi:hypothetical protein